MKTVYFPRVWAWTLLSLAGLGIATAENVKKGAAQSSGASASSGGHEGH